MCKAARLIGITKDRLLVVVAAGLETAKTTAQPVLGGEVVWNEMLLVEPDASGAVQLTVHEARGQSLGVVGSLVLHPLEMLRGRPSYETWVKFGEEHGRVAGGQLLVRLMGRPRASALGQGLATGCTNSASAPVFGSTQPRRWDKDKGMWVDQ